MTRLEVGEVVVPSQAVGCSHSLSSSFALCKCRLVWHLGMLLAIKRLEHVKLYLVSLLVCSSSDCALSSAESGAFVVKRV